MICNPRISHAVVNVLKYYKKDTKHERSSIDRLYTKVDDIYPCHLFELFTIHQFHSNIWDTAGQEHIYTTVYKSPNT